jgi:hypothetical protein
LRGELGSRVDADLVQAGRDIRPLLGGEIGEQRDLLESLWLHVKASSRPILFGPQRPDVNRA